MFPFLLIVGHPISGAINEWWWWWWFVVSLMAVSGGLQRWNFNISLVLSSCIHFLLIANSFWRWHNISCPAFYSCHLCPVMVSAWVLLCFHSRLRRWGCSVLLPTIISSYLRYKWSTNGLNLLRPCVIMWRHYISASLHHDSLTLSLFFWPI